VLITSQVGVEQQYVTHLRVASRIVGDIIDDRAIERDRILGLSGALLLDHLL